MILGRFGAYGPALRFGGWASRWIGNFMVGGGPVLHYSYLTESGPAKDHLQLFTLQGDLLLGGGRYEKFAIYGHVTLGGGIMSAKDGASGISLTLPGVRLAAGVGGHGYITPRFSLGALADFGYLGGLGVDLLITANVHFGRGTKG